MLDLAARRSNAGLQLLALLVPAAHYMRPRQRVSERTARQPLPAPGTIRRAITGHLVAEVQSRIGSIIVGGPVGAADPGCSVRRRPTP
jgi:hypothetical protein